MKQAKIRVLVTGATGFLGSHILEALTTVREVQPIAACRHRDGLPPAYKGEVRVGDLRDPDYLSQVVREVDVICHAAAWTSMWAHRREEDHNYRKPTFALIDAAQAAGVQRFIFPSSPVVAPRGKAAIADNAPAQHPGFWPHLEVVVDIEHQLRRLAGRSMQMVVLRLGHFVGERYRLGLLSLLLPRLKTHLVPWVAGGHARLPLTDGRDLAQGFALACTATDLQAFESFNICGPAFPTMHEVLNFLHAEIGTPLPHFSVPRVGAYAFAWMMEQLNIVLPGDPFLTRAIVWLGEDWFAPSELARQRLGYQPKIPWQEAIRHQLAAMEANGYARVPLA